ncbi:MAG TPA: adenosylcobinamide-phosphate synthase CbiB [Polyangiales bacterium]|nr:adenosylcobinamide-phosphate synthase CbiB [Polyangiales bacterium]
MTLAHLPELAVLALAIAFDYAVRLPNALHPVAWFGRAAGWVIAKLPTHGRTLPFVAGLGVAVVLPLTAAVLVGRVLAWSDAHLPAIALIGVRGVLLATTFSLFGLLDAGKRLEVALRTQGLDAARARLSWLCSRDPSTLDASQLAGGTIESLAENLSDSVVAPLLCWLAFGVEGAVWYRAVNTLDAMIGYRGKYEWLGKAAARLDDLANLVPARVTALALFLAAPARRGLTTWRRDRSLTESPNAGHPMAMAAGLLGVRLDKPGVYSLGADLAAPQAHDIERAIVLVRRAGLLVFAACLLCAGMLGTGTFHVAL